MKKTTVTEKYDNGELIERTTITEETKEDEWAMPLLPSIPVSPYSPYPYTTPWCNPNVVYCNADSSLSGMLTERHGA